MKSKIKLIPIISIMAIILSSCGTTEPTNVEETSVSSQINLVEQGDIFDGYTLIEVDGGDQSGDREANVVVDIGFGDREYYGFTNEYGQLIQVVADDIILQDDDSEPVLSSGRYYYDEAKVPGVESPTLDEGHVIADSLGGVSNAYNITPQESTLNRHGDQAYMEDAIRDAGGAEDFFAVITYPNNETQIPSHYSYTYTINGNVIHDEFDNVNPDDYNEELNNIEESQEDTNENTEETVINSEYDVDITDLDKSAEYIELTNNGDESVDMTNWVIVSVKGDQRFTFPEFELEPDESVKVGDTEKNDDIDFYWLEGQGTWNNSESDPAELYDENNNLVDRYED